MRRDDPGTRHQTRWDSNGDHSWTEEELRWYESARSRGETSRDWPLIFCSTRRGAEPM